MKTNTNNPYAATQHQQPQQAQQQQQSSNLNHLDINNNTNSSAISAAGQTQANSAIINTSFNVFDYQKSEISPVNSCQESTISSTGSSSSSSYESKQTAPTSYNTYGNFHQSTSNLVNQDVNYFRQYSSAVYGTLIILFYLLYSFLNFL